MALQTWKRYRAWFSRKEATAFTADTTAFFEGRGKMTLPEPEYQVESDYGKLGSGEHGKKNELQAVWAPWTYTCDRLSEIAYFLSFFQGNDDAFIVPSAGLSLTYVHELKHLPVRSRTLPTFTIEMLTGESTDNEVISGCIVNEFSLSFSSGGNGLIEASFSGWGNRHRVVDGALTANAAGSMSSGAFDFSAEPLVNFKACDFWLADAMESSFGKTSVDFEGEDLGANLKNVTSLVSSVTISGNNGMSADNAARAGGHGVLNDSTRGDRRYTFEFSMWKNRTTIDFNTERLTDKQRSFELGFYGKDIETNYPYGLDIFFPVVQVLSGPEDEGSPITKSYTTEVFEDTEGDSMIAYVQSKVNVGYNSVA